MEGELPVDKISFLPFFLQSFPESVMILVFGITLVRSKLGVRNLLIIAFFTTIFSYIIRSQEIVFGVHSLLQFTFMIILLRFLGRQKWVVSISISLLSFLGLGVVESITLPILVNLSGISFNEVLQSSWLRLLFSWIEISMLGVITWYLWKRKWYIFDAESFTVKLKKGTFFLINIGFLQALFVVTLNINFTIYKTGYFLTMELDQLFFITSVILFAGFIITMVMAYYMLQVSRKEAYLEEQRKNLESMQDLFMTMGTQRHDFHNHVTSLYGYIKYDKVAEAKEYMETLYEDVRRSTTLQRMGIPSLIGLFQAKSARAEKEGIHFNYSTDGRFAKVPLKPIELTGILGNLIDNAFDAAKASEKEKPMVRVSLGKDFEGNFIIEVRNTSKPIEKDVLKKMFHAGYSTKDKSSHSGLGLYNVQKIVNKYQGKINVSQEDDLVIFEIFIPERQEESLAE